MGYLARRWRSVCFAWQGLQHLLATQANARIHLAATVLVLLAGGYCHISRLEWLALVGAIAWVWVAEALNTGIECVVDLASPELHPKAGQAKDVAAAAVLLASVAAVVVGVLIFGPKLMQVL
jgi:diacylglycerol kinase (ATP)